MVREAGEDPRSKPKRRSAKRAKERHPIAAALFPSDVEPGERALWDRVFNAPAVREIADEPVVLSSEVSPALVEVWGAGAVTVPGRHIRLRPRAARLRAHV